MVNIAVRGLGYRGCGTLSRLKVKYVDWLRQQGPVPEYFTEAERELKDARVGRFVWFT